MKNRSLIKGFISFFMLKMMTNRSRLSLTRSPQIYLPIEILFSKNGSYDGRKYYDIFEMAPLFVSDNWQIMILTNAENEAYILEHYSNKAVL